MSTEFYPTGWTTIHQLASQHSARFTFTVSAEDGSHFARVAMRPDRGDVLTFRLQAGAGEPVELGEGQWVDVFEKGYPKPAGEASITAEDNGLHLIEIQPNSTGLDWTLTIENTDQLSVLINAVAGDSDHATLVPWLHFAVERGFINPNWPPATVVNRGTTTLWIDEPIGVHLGGPDSPYVLRDLPSQLEPGAVGSLEVECVIGFPTIAYPHGPPVITHQLQCNDPNPEHTLITVVLVDTGPTDHNTCSAPGCTCRDYEPGGIWGDPTRCRNCGHDPHTHFGE
ncbi:hypothetical protein ABZW96_35535 [Nocardia sp. NPDC004168]|uniref:hypothetical protein n=1 Tax=Nocardia sp. NPDC004168 TaxID=3154452 RepID=UPI0033B4FEF5